MVESISEPKRVERPLILAPQHRGVTRDEKVTRVAIDQIDEMCAKQEGSLEEREIEEISKTVQEAIVSLKESSWEGRPVIAVAINTNRLVTEVILREQLRQIDKISAQMSKNIDRDRREEKRWRQEEERRATERSDERRWEEKKSEEHAEDKKSVARLQEGLQEGFKKLKPSKN